MLLPPGNEEIEGSGPTEVPPNVVSEPESLSLPRPLAPPLGVLRGIGLAALAAALMAATAGIFTRYRQDQEVAQWTAVQAVPAVSVITPQRDGASSKMILPGNIEAWYEAPIYSRVNGYLKNWYVDYGAHVKAGQLLAEIDAPDLDGEFAAAKSKLQAANAQVKVRQAELDFATTTYERWLHSPKGVVSVQETLAKKGDFDSATARYNAALADVDAAKGTVDRLQALEDYKRITAPFDGVVTERNTDVGALINAGSGVGGGSGPVLFKVADVQNMRIFVQVPQKLSAGIVPGVVAELRLPQYPDQTFKAKVATTSQAINTAARTLLVELHADNPDSVLQPGSYTEVHFNLPGDPTALSLPTSALLFRHNGLQVAVVGKDNRIELKNIALGRNFGRRVQVLRGLTPDDRVVNHPPDSLTGADLVRIADDGSPAGSPMHAAAGPAPPLPAGAGSGGRAD